jgi:hypothetical protein
MDRQFVCGVLLKLFVFVVFVIPHLAIRLGPKK